MSAGNGVVQDLRARLLKIAAERDHAEVPCGLPAMEEVLGPRRSIAERLYDKYGWGADAKKRRELYARVQACCDAEGQPAIDVVSSCVADAVGKDRPGHWFCSAVIRRLREAGLAKALSKGGDASW